MLAIVLTAQQSASPPPKPSKPMGSFDDPAAARPFKSVGVRGTIDAGGYAASATVKAQSEFFELLAQSQVAALRAAWDLPERCAVVEKLQRGDAGAAVDGLEKLLRTDDEPATHRLLGLAYEGLGQFGAAADQFRVAAGSAVPPNEADIFSQSVALLFDGNVDAAEEVSRKTPSGLARLSLGAALFQHGDVRKALNVFLEAAKARPEESAAFGFIAVAVRTADSASLTFAIDELDSLTRRSGKNGSIPYALACALLAARGETQAIEEQLKRAVALDPQLAEAHFRLGAVYAEREDLQAAIAEYRIALECNPRLVEAHYRLSQLYERCGQQQLGKAELELYQQLRAQQKAEIESGRIRFQFPGLSKVSCP